MDNPDVLDNPDILDKSDISDKSDNPDISDKIKAAALPFRVSRPAGECFYSVGFFTLYRSTAFRAKIQRPSSVCNNAAHAHVFPSRFCDEAYLVGGI